MNDTPDTPPLTFDPATDPDGLPWSDVEPDDFFLDSLLSLCLGSDDRGRGGYLGLTVTAGGVVVMGQAITAEEYVQRAGEVLSNTPEISAGFMRVASTVLSQRSEADEKREVANLLTPPRRFLHMRDARIYGGPQWISVPLWRARMSTIDSWSIGSHN